MLKLSARGDIMNMYHKKQEKNTEQKEGDDTMSATTQNHIYSYGKKKQGVKDEHVLSSKRLEEIKSSLQKYRTEKK